MSQSRERERETDMLILSMETRKENAEFLFVDQVIEQMRKISDREEFFFGTLMRTSKNDDLRVRWILSLSSNENTLRQEKTDQNLKTALTELNLNETRTRVDIRRTRISHLTFKDNHHRSLSLSLFLPWMRINSCNE